MMKSQKHTTVLFIIFILLAGVLHFFDSSPDIDVNTVLFSFHFTICAGLILFWLQTVRQRLLPTRARTYLSASAGFMLMMLTLRALRYRIGIQMIMKRYLWYAYYLPMLFIPTLFLLACIRICYPHGSKRRTENLILAAAFLLSFGILTNDIHYLAFSPVSDSVAEMNGDAGTEVYSVLYYASCVWIGFTVLTGICLLFLSFQESKELKKAVIPFNFFLLFLFMIGMQQLLHHLDIRQPYALPEIVIFCMIGVFESCIRLRLIPYNVDSESIFRVMELPAMITGTDFKPVLQSASPLNVSLSECQKALQEPVYPAEYLRLQGKAIRGGYVFWTADEQELHKLNEKLLEANETLAAENTLIEAENRQREEIARMDFESHIHHQIAEELYPMQIRIRKMLENMRPGEDSFQQKLAMVCVLNAYVKRATNLMFMAAESDAVSSRELYLAMGETARYLKYVGVFASVTDEARTHFSSEEVFPVYKTFEQLVEALLPQITLMSATLYDCRLRLAVNTESADLPETVLPVRKMTEDGMLYLTVFWKGAPA